MKQKNIGMKIIRKLIDFIVGSGNKQRVKNEIVIVDIHQVFKYMCTLYTIYYSIIVQYNI